MNRFGFKWLVAGVLIAAPLVYAACASTESAETSRPQRTEAGNATSEKPNTPATIPAYPRAVELAFFPASDGQPARVALCQATQPFLDGVHSDSCGPYGGEPGWDARAPIPWQMFAQGAYIGPARESHVPEYRLRVDDEIEFVYRLTRNQTHEPYRLNVGDQVRIESLIDEKLNRDLEIQPDGTITLLLLGQMRAAGLTVEELRSTLNAAYQRTYQEPSIVVTPLKMNTRLEDLRSAVDSRAGEGGQNERARVTPEGMVQLTAIGSVPAQGLTLDELGVEINERFREIVDGIEVTPRLLARAPRFVFIGGEVRQPGRYTLEGPTTVMQAIALAEGWKNGANLRQVVVFRRDEHWRLMATRLDLRGGMLGQQPAPADNIDIRDSDLIIVPKGPILLADDFIELVFTRGIYGVIPLQGISINFAKASTL